MLTCNWKNPGQDEDEAEDDDEYSDDAEGDGRESSALSSVKRGRGLEQEDGQKDEGQDVKKVKV
jgi:hypothetical protein